MVFKLISQKYNNGLSAQMVDSSVDTMHIPGTTAVSNTKDEWQHIKLIVKRCC